MRLSHIHLQKIDSQPKWRRKQIRSMILSEFSRCGLRSIQCFFFSSCYSWWFVLFLSSFIRHVHIECSTHFMLYVVERIMRLNPITSCVHCVFGFIVCMRSAWAHMNIVRALLSLFSQFQPKIVVWFFYLPQYAFSSLFFSGFLKCLIRKYILFGFLVSKFSCCCCWYGCCLSTLQWHFNAQNFSYTLTVLFCDNQ